MTELSNQELVDAIRQGLEATAKVVAANTLKERYVSEIVSKNKETTPPPVSS